MEMVLYSRLRPLCFPSALSKRVCHPDPRGPWRETHLMDWPGARVWQLAPPSILRTGEPAKGWGGGGQCPPPYISFCKYSALIKLYSRQVWPHWKRPWARGAVGDRSESRPRLGHLPSMWKRPCSQFSGVPSQ